MLTGLEKVLVTAGQGEQRLARSTSWWTWSVASVNQSSRRRPEAASRSTAAGRRCRVPLYIHRAPQRRQLSTKSIGDGGPWDPDDGIGRGLPGWDLTPS